MNDTQPLYNSRILKVYLEYLQSKYPDIGLNTLLEEIGIEKYKIDDPAHWLTQSQVDRFHNVTVKHTGEPDIARNAGRYFTESRGFGATKQYALGLITPVAMFLMVDKLYPMLSRGADVKSKKIGPCRIEMVSTPKPGVAEKVFQCENRMGFLEGSGKLFTDKYMEVDHPECFHKGGNCCRYIISWQQSPVYFWKMIRNYFLGLSVLACVILLFILPYSIWSNFLLAGAVLTSLSAYNFERLENKSLQKRIEAQKEAAEENLLESSIRYNNALLIHEIGKAISKILNIDMIVETVAQVLQKRLDFDRGIIMLVNEEKNRLVYKSGYGHTEEQLKLLHLTEFHLDDSNSAGLFIKALKERKPFLVNDISDIQDSFSKRSLELIQQLGVQSLICVPIIYEEEALGVLAVDKSKSKDTLRESDMNMLMGVASGIAIGIINARSFKKIEESESRYRLLADNISDVIWILDIPGSTYSYISPSVQQVHGWTPDEFMNLSLEEFLPPRSLDLAEKIISEELRKEKSKNEDPMRSRILEMEQFCKDGSLIWVEITARFLRDKNGRVTAILGVSRDITDRKKTENEKRKLELQLQQAHKMEAVGTLAGGIAHDFNNILSIILGNLELSMLDMPEWNPALKNLKEARIACFRARDVIRHILSFSRQPEQERHPVILSSILKESLKLLRSSIPTSIEIRQNIPEISNTILADSSQIHQVIINLCTNASYAMKEKGGVLEAVLTERTLDNISARQYADLPPGRYMELSISDTGHGIDPKIIGRIFDPYFTTKRIDEGSGMGLAVVHGIVKSHGGAITVYSEMGKGSIFRILFPIIDAKVASEKEIEEELPKGKEKILYVDDEPYLADIGRQMLEYLGYQVESATNPVEALETFRSDPDKFDLVITDMTMPHMTGRVLAQELINIRPDIPVILNTGYSDQINEKKAKEIGIKAFIIKPLNIMQLGKTIRSILDNKQTV